MSRHRGLATRKEQDRLNEVMNEIMRIVGHHVTAECFGSGSWRVWLRDYHFHPGTGVTRDVTGHGETCLEAAERCLEILKTDKTVREGNCREGCPKWDPCLY
jgi:hypothetical protein